MTSPPDIIYLPQGGSDSRAFGDSGPGDPNLPRALPDPILRGLSTETLDELKIWLDQRLRDLITENQSKQQEWKQYEKDYRSRSEGGKDFPFKGACDDVIPVTAMAVDPIHARLDTGIFKQDPIFRLKALKKSMIPYSDPLEKWIEFNVKNRWNLRSVASPRMLEFCKLGSMVFKTVYDRDITDILTYDKDFNVVKKQINRYAGPRVVGISLDNFLYPAGYEHVQDCPIVAERITTNFWDLKVQERSSKIANVDELKNQQTISKTALQLEREAQANHPDLRMYKDDITVYECWFDYDIDGDSLPERMVALYHLETRTFLRLQYNYYFHQRKPYTLIPYTTTNGDLGGLGIGEMVSPFQAAITRWHQMASDNAYLANVRMYIAKKESGIEQVPRLYPGRVFFVDNPSEDFIPFRAADTYPSTLAERQNIFGMVEKRTGVSDYLTGRESPIIGTRATATSTLALIQEGTKRVEQVLENIRSGFSEIILFCIYLWIQFGVGEIDDLVFGDDEIGQKVKEFFDTQISEKNIEGSFAIDLTATDAAGSRQAQQQMQLAIIQIMMGYLEKILAAGQAALVAQQQLPQYTAMVADVMQAGHSMFKDLLTKYDIRNPEDYLPDLEKYLNGQSPLTEPLAGGSTNPLGPVGGLGASGGIPTPPPGPGPGGPNGAQAVGASLSPVQGLTLAGPRAGA